MFNGLDCFYGGKKVLKLPNFQVQREIPRRDSKVIRQGGVVCQIVQPCCGFQVGLYAECNAAGLNDAVFLLDKSKIQKYNSSVVSKYSSQFSLIINHHLTKNRGIIWPGRAWSSLGYFTPWIGQFILRSILELNYTLA